MVSMQKLILNFSIALEAVLANRVRSVLTALGIIFGVAAVIAMLAIGNGAQQEILEQIKLVGVNNIVINPIVEQSEEESVGGGKRGGNGKEKILSWFDKILMLGRLKTWSPASRGSVPRSFSIRIW